MDGGREPSVALQEAQDGCPRPAGRRTSRTLEGVWHRSRGEK